MVSETVVVDGLTVHINRGTGEIVGHGVSDEEPAESFHREIRGLLADGARRRADDGADDEPDVDAPRGPAPELPDDGATADAPDPTLFDDAGFYRDPRLEDLGEAIRADFPELSQVGNIVWRWKKKGGKAGPTPRLAKVQLLSGISQHFARGADYLLWVAADHVAEQKLTNRQLRAVIYHQLCHLHAERDEETLVLTLSVRGPDFVGFHRELDRFGAWSESLEAMVDAADLQRQMPLPGVS